MVGRSIESDLAIDDPFLSRRHFRLFRAGGTLLVEDLGSRNGTLLNDRPVLAATPIRGVVVFDQGTVDGSVRHRLC